MTVRFLLGLVAGVTSTGLTWLGSHNLAWAAGTGAITFAAVWAVETCIERHR